MNKISSKIIRSKSNNSIQNMIVRKNQKVNKIRIITRIKNSRTVSKYMRMSKLLPTTTMVKEF